MSREGKRLAWCFVAIIVVGVVVYLANSAAATRQAQTQYENLIAGCHRANAHYKADGIVIEAATQSSNEHVAAGATAALKLIREQPHVRRDGTTECGKAIEAP